MNVCLRLAPRALLFSVFCVGLVFLSAESAAQVVTPSNGLDLPFPTTVDRGDALSLELNPAGLARVGGWETIYAQTYRGDNLNDGFGFFTAFPIFSGISTGFAVQALDQGISQDAYRKYTVGLGFGDRLSMGVNYNFFGSDTSRSLDELSAWDLGFQWRALSWLGFSAMFRDFDSPFIQGQTIKARATLGTALRFFEGRLLFEGNLTVLPDTKRLLPRFFTAVEPIEGVRVFGQALTDTGQEGDEFTFTQATMGLQFNLPYLGFTGAGIVGDGRDGFSALVRTSSLRWRSFYKSSKSFYRISLAGDFDERAKMDVFGFTRSGSFLSLMRRMERMSKDPKVGGLILDLRGVSAGFGQIWELQQAISRMRDQGIPVIAFLHSTSYRDYLIASSADKIIATPSSAVSPRGFSTSRMYLREAFDKLGVEPQFLKIDEYKSAPEMYTRNSPTEPADRSLQVFMDAVWENNMAAIAKGRGFSTERAQELINSAPHIPSEALQNKLIDEVMYEDELKKYIKENFDTKRISKNYIRPTRDYEWATSKSDKRIAVIYIDSTIVSGKSVKDPLFGSSFTGDKSIIAAARSALKDSSVGAVVVRVDSPGGSALASDRIYRALDQLSEKKPVIISMGDITASGGYYAAAAGDSVVCAPTTLTGSIGIFTGQFATQGLLSKLGISEVSAKRGVRADLYSGYDAWTEEEMDVLRKQIGFLYGRFLDIVAEGRGVSKKYADEVGRGRIWPGTLAKEKKLCDQHGGILDAIALAKKRAGIEEEDVGLIALPRETLGFSASLLGALSTSSLLKRAAEDVTWDEAYEAHGPLRRLLAPARPILEIALTFEDGEALALLPYVDHVGKK